MSLRIASAICLCAGCLLFCCSNAAPPLAKRPDQSGFVTNSTEEAAVEYLYKTYYSNPEFAEKSAQYRSLIAAEIKKIEFNFPSIANRSQEEWQHIVRQLFMSYSLKQKSMSARVTNLLYKTLSISEPEKLKISKEERANILSQIPTAVINRIERWNERPMRRAFEDVVFIATPKENTLRGIAWSFTLEKPMATKNILNLKLGIHLTPESQILAAGVNLSVRYAIEVNRETTQIPLLSLRKMFIAGKVNVDNRSKSEEILVDITEAIRPKIYHMQDKSYKKNPLELYFFVECEDCGNILNVTYMVMDCKMKVEGYPTSADETVQSRKPRQIGERLQWPFDNTTATEVFKNLPPGTTFTKTQMCIIENVNRRYGQKSCCLMEFTYDMSHQGVVLAPRQLRISYCAGECHGQSQVHTPHSSLLQIVGHSQSKLSHETKEDINLCCVANAYRDFQVLTVGRPPADSTKTSVQLKVIKDISAESCTCA